MIGRLKLSGTLFFVCVLASGPSGFAQKKPDLDVRTINGLKQRRLFDLAASYGRERLDEIPEGQRPRIDICVAVIDALTQKAFQSRDPAAWDDVHRLAEQWQNNEKSQRMILLTVQAVLIDQMRIEQAILEINSDMATAAIREELPDRITGVTDKLGEIQKEITSLMNRRPRQGTDSFTPNDLLALRYNMEYQQARALIHRASLFGPGEEVNRNDVLTLAEQQLALVLQSVGPEETLWWTVQADRIAVSRTSENFRVASSIVASLPQSGGDPVARDRLTAEWIRTLTVMQRWEDAVGVAGKGSEASRSPPLDLARIELYVAMAGRDNAEKWQQRALQLTASIEEKHGGYWARLANISVVGTAAATPRAGSNLDLLVRVADEAQRKKQWAEAIQALDAAAGKAVENRQPEIAYKLEFRAAAIEQQQERFAEAANRYERLANRFATVPDAHAASLMACWNQARIIGSDQERFERYEKMLAHVIDTWPDSSSADQARIWLAFVRHNQRNWPSTVQLLLNVNAASPLFRSAVERLRRVIYELQGAPDVAEGTRSTIMVATMERLAPLLTVDQAAMPENWQQTIGQVVLQLAELKYVYRLPVKGELTGALDRMIGAETPDPQELASALALRYVAVAAEPQAYVESGVFSRLEPGPLQLAILLRGLSETDGETPDSDRARMLLSAAKRFARQIDDLPPLSRKQWGQAEIAAMVATGANAEAVAVARKLVGLFPKDAGLQVGLARLLTDLTRSGAAPIDEALRQWRVVARFSPGNSPNWFLAKYHVAELNAAAGNREEALKLLRFIKAVPPGWSKADNAASFDELYRSLGGR